MAIHVYKVGGSLLSLPDLTRRLTDLVVSHGCTSPLLITGGGPAADIVRGWQTTHGFDEDTAHDLALQAMALNQHLVDRLLPRGTLVTNRDEADRAWRDGRWSLLDAGPFLSSEEPAHSLALPHTWQASSDAIAAWVAIHWPADRLVLLKSTDRPAGSTAATLADAGLVDPCLAHWADRLPRVDWVNLRSAVPRSTPWLS